MINRYKNLIEKKVEDILIDLGSGIRPSWIVDNLEPTLDKIILEILETYIASQPTTNQPHSRKPAPNSAIET